MLHAIDYSFTDRRAYERTTADLPPVPAGYTRLLAADYEHLSTYEDTPAELDTDGTSRTPASRRLLRPGVAVEYQRRADEWAASQPVPVTDLATVKAEATAQLAAMRYEREVGGFDYLGERVMSDRESQSKIGDLALGIQFSGDAFSVAWKCYGGEWLHLDKAGALGLIAAGFSHVGGLFNREAVFSERIQAATTVEEVKAILSEF